MKRYEELDSLRGLAALTVFFGHCVTLASLPVYIKDLLPLRIFWSAHEAVVFFFILSGFVLSLPFYNSKVHYPTYLTKRIFRIYVPYLCAIVISMLISVLLLDRSFTFRSLINHLLLIGNYNTDQYNSVIWSLVQEMRISILFPLIMFFISRFSWKFNILIGMFFSMLSGLNQYFNFNQSLGYFTSYFDTLHFISMFIIGSLLAKYREQLITKVNSLTIKQKTLIIVIGLGLYTYSNLFILTDLNIKYILSEYGIALGAGIITIFSLSLKRIRNFLNLKPVLFLGKISYSVYLYHLILLFTFLHFFGGKGFFYMTIAFVLAGVCTILMAKLSWHFIEKPSIFIGKKVANYFWNEKKYKNTKIAS